MFASGGPVPVRLKADTTYGHGPPEDGHYVWMDGRVVSRQTQPYPAVLSGTDRIRTPVAAKMALVIAGIAGGSAGSPSPVGSKSVCRNFTSIDAGIWFIRVGW